MSRLRQGEVVCQICKAPKRHSEVIPAELVRPPIVNVIRRSYPDWNTEGYICIPDLNRFRSMYIEDVVESDKGELSALEKQVVDSIKEHEVLSSNINIDFERRLTIGERLADGVAAVGGSWRFVILFFMVLSAWVLMNASVLVTQPFDPYPYILLNLVLSCLAAIQAPIIMMSQNRQEAKDRMRAEQDYRINLKAELEIRHLHEKLDHLLMQQWQRLIEIQEIQIEIMKEVSGNTRQ